MTFAFTDLTQLWLEISSAVQAESWQQSQSFSSPGSCWNAYLNQLCLNAILPWLQEEYAPEATAWSSNGNLSSFWEVVNGSAISMEGIRLVLIPTETIDTSELRVPQEWVDIPSWVADYYLAVQVNPDEQGVRIWGYTTHQQLKISSSYDPSDRTYCLDADNLIQDLNVLWVTRQLCPDEPTREAVPSLPPLPAAQAENLVQRLANPAIALPRLAVPFQLWGALLEQDSWRQQLYQQRQNQALNVARSEVERLQPTTQPSNLQPATSLSQWFQNIFDAGWQAIEVLLGSDSDNLALSLRSTSKPSETVVRRAKLIHLVTQESSLALLLLLVLEAEADDRVGIRVQLRPRENDACLPANLRLALLSPSGETIQAVESRTQDDYIQLKRFKCPPGQQFSLQVAIAEVSMTEEFVS